MARGDLINYNNLPVPPYGTFDSGTIVGKYNSKIRLLKPNTTIWVSAPVFIASMQVDSVLFREPEMNMYVYRWNGGNGFDFVVRGHIYASGYGSDGWRFAHNCNDIQIGGIDYRDDGGVHLYKLVIESIGEGSSTWQALIYAGSVKSSCNTNANTYARGRLIRACRPEIFVKGETYSNDIDFINGENPLARRGVPIDMTNAHYVYGEY